MGGQARAHRGGCTRPGRLGARPHPLLQEPQGRQQHLEGETPFPEAFTQSLPSSGLCLCLSKIHTLHPNNRQGDFSAWGCTQAVPGAVSSPQRGQMGLPAALERTRSQEVRQTGREGAGHQRQWEGGSQARPGYWFPIHLGKLTFQHQMPKHQVAGVSSGGPSSSAKLQRKP